MSHIHIFYTAIRTRRNGEDYDYIDQCMSYGRELSLRRQDKRSERD